MLFNGGSPDPQQAVYMAIREGEEFIEASVSVEENRVHAAWTDCSDCDKQVVMSSQWTC